MARKSVGFKIGSVTFCIHLCLAVFAFVAYINSQSSTAGLVFIYFFFLDAPIHFLITLLPFSVFDFSVIMPFIIYGIFGSLLWFLIPWIGDRLSTRVFPNITGKIRWISVIGSIPFILLGFIYLGSLSTMLSIRQERPNELKKLLDSTPSGYLNQRVVFDDMSIGGISSISQVASNANAESDILLTCHRGAVFLNGSYEEQSRIMFYRNSFYTTVDPVYTGDIKACYFIAYKLFKQAILLDSNGKEIWKTVEAADGGPYIDGVQSGDIDGNGKPEFPFSSTSSIPFLYL